jgi:uridine phosphorylase
MESSLLFVFAQTHGLQAASILAVDGNLHKDPKEEQRDESQKTGEQSPLVLEAIEKETKATVRAIDRLFRSRTT